MTLHRENLAAKASQLELASVFQEVVTIVNFIKNKHYFYAHLQNNLMRFMRHTHDFCNTKKNCWLSRRYVVRRVVEASDELIDF